LSVSSPANAQGDWHTEEVEFENAGAVLSGTLFMPTTTPPVATVVLIHGSGPEERMAWFAALLAADGLAVMTYDKRGVGLSGGVYEQENNVSSSNLSLLASDAAAAFAAVSKHPRLAEIPGGFAGFSQAGWIAPLAAVQSPSATFIALWSGAVCTVDEEIHFSALAQNYPSSLETYSNEGFSEFLASVDYRPDDFDPRHGLS
jgi:alpha-beta hydrolase superfamily lysophospholipase